MGERIPTMDEQLPIHTFEYVFVCHKNCSLDGKIRICKVAVEFLGIEEDLSVRKIESPAERPLGKMKFRSYVSEVRIPFEDGESGARMKRCVLVRAERLTRNKIELICPADVNLVDEVDDRVDDLEEFTGSGKKEEE